MVIPPIILISAAILIFLLVIATILICLHIQSLRQELYTESKKHLSRIRLLNIRIDDTVLALEGHITSKPKKIRVRVKTSPEKRHRKWKGEKNS